MRKFLKKGIVSLMAVAMALGTFCFTSCAKKEDSDSFTIWVGSSVNSSFYSDYGSNPVMQYWQKKFGIKVQFVSPIVGKEEEEFNKYIGSGTYPDMMDITFYTDVMANLYDDGYGAALDLTKYIEDYMPNYSAFLQDNAELTKYAKVGGKYITINNYNAGLPKQWGGFMYRRDWLVKYDGNEDVPDKDGNYIDGVKFPDGILIDGYDNPLTIRDWEYMFEIFKKSPDCEYAITVPSKGYHETGDIVSAFGVGGLFNLYDENGTGSYDTVKFGAVTDSFKKYIETMNKWYKNGWLDKDFISHSGDLFYALDSRKVTSGNVGMWYGTVGQIGDVLYTESQEKLKSLEGIDVWGARQPKESADSPDPTIFYFDGRETTRRWIVTQTAKKKNIQKLFNALDWFYSEEGSIVKKFGLSKEQWDEYPIDKSLMEKYGLKDGAYWYCDANGNKVEKGTPDALIHQKSFNHQRFGRFGRCRNGRLFLRSRL